jgi:hypothetical protein
MIQHKLLYCACTILPPPPLSRARPLVPFERRQCCPSFARFSTWLAPTHPTHPRRLTIARRLVTPRSFITHPFGLFSLRSMSVLFSFFFFVYRTHLFCICLVVVCPFLFGVTYSLFLFSSLDVLHPCGPWLSFLFSCASRCRRPSAPRRSQEPFVFYLLVDRRMSQSAFFVLSHRFGCVQSPWCEARSLSLAQLNRPISSPSSNSNQSVLMLDPPPRSSVLVIVVVIRPRRHRTQPFASVDGSIPLLSSLASTISGRRCCCSSYERSSCPVPSHEPNPPRLAPALRLPPPVVQYYSPLPHTRTPPPSARAHPL